MIAAGDIDKLDLEGLSDERRPVFAGGVAILLAIFHTLGIEHMRVSSQALREGLLYDLLGRIQDEDVRPADGRRFCSTAMRSIARRPTAFT